MSSVSQATRRPSTAAAAVRTAPRASTTGVARPVVSSPVVAARKTASASTVAASRVHARATLPAAAAVRMPSLPTSVTGAATQARAAMPLFASPGAAGASASTATHARTGAAATTSTGDRGVQQAMEEARVLLEGGGGAVGTQTSVGGTVVMDPASVTARAHQAAEAAAQVEKNAQIESIAVNMLSPAQQEQYARVRAGTVAAQDPVATLALQKMLVEGKIPGTPSLGGTPAGDLLTQLDTLATQPMNAELEPHRHALVSQVVQEVAVPQAINQGQVGSCGPTAVMQQLAGAHPAEYARLVAGLASTDGKVTMANGDVLQREAYAYTDENRKDRALSQFLLGPALTEYGTGALRDYDPLTDRSSFPGGLLPLPGTHALEVSRISSAVFGRDITTTTLRRMGEIMKDPRTLGLPGSAGDVALRAFEAGQLPVMVGLPADEDMATPGLQGDAGHWVTVTGTGTDENGQAYVEFTNPWGQVERMPRETFTDLAWDGLAPPA